MIFFETQKPSFYKIMLGIITTNFFDMLLIRERIEKRIKNGRVDGHDPHLRSIMPPVKGRSSMPHEVKLQGLEDGFDRPQATRHRQT